MFSNIFFNKIKRIKEKQKDEHRTNLSELNAYILDNYEDVQKIVIPVMPQVLPRPDENGLSRVAQQSRKEPSVSDFRSAKSSAAGCSSAKMACASMPFEEPVLYSGARECLDEGMEPYEKLELDLKKRMAHLSDTFQEYLFYFINMKGMSNAEVHKRALIDKKVFSKIKNNPDYHPKKITALCLCIGLKLNLDEAKDLLARAGYTFSPCDKTDIIFSYFIENEIYDMIEIDIQLEEHGLPCIIN